LVELLDATEDRASGEVFYALRKESCVVLVSAGSPMQDWLESLPERVAGTRVGLSEPVGYEQLATGMAQAEHALAAVSREVATSRFADVAATSVLALLDPGAARAFAESVLAPLREHDRRIEGDLLGSLRAWLECHGQCERAAHRLGVHRHTLRHRITRIAALLERDLDAPGVRAELWLALEITDYRGGDE
jgi:purine catabolism regulator